LLSLIKVIREAINIRSNLRLYSPLELSLLPAITIASNHYVVQTLLVSGRLGAFV